MIIIKVNLLSDVNGPTTELEISESGLQMYFENCMRAVAVRALARRQVSRVTRK